MTADDDLGPSQLAAMDALWNARRRDEVDPREADEIEVMIRTGPVAPARRRLTEARLRTLGQRIPPGGG